MFFNSFLEEAFCLDVVDVVEILEKTSLVVFVVVAFWSGLRLQSCHCGTIRTFYRIQNVNFGVP